jgi:hypothetical protein
MHYHFRLTGEVTHVLSVSRWVVSMPQGWERRNFATSCHGDRRRRYCDDPQSEALRERLRRTKCEEA